MSRRRQPCEWCASFASWLLDDGNGYRRYTCNEHLSKAKRLAFLDGRDETSVTSVYVLDERRVRFAGSAVKP